MNAYIRVAATVLVCLNALTLTVYPQQGDHQRRRQPSSLYQVSVWDEKSHRKKFGFIDKSGKLVIGFDRLPETTFAVGEFHEGRATIIVEADKERKETGSRFGKKVGFIDETGRVVIAPRFDSVRDFSEGLAFAWGDGFMGFIDREGKEVFKVDDYTVGDFHDGLASAGLIAKDRGEAGYINREGKQVIKQPYRFVEDFSEGLAGVEVSGSRFSGQFGFINTKGEMVIPPRFASRIGSDAMITIATSRFSEGLACVTGEGGFGYINKNGEFVIKPQFSEAQEFSEGLAWVRTQQGKVGWIDKSGNWAATFAVYNLSPNGPELTSTTVLMDWRFSEGLVPFVSWSYSDNTSLFGYLNRKGEIAIQPMKLSSAGPFLGGLAKVTFYERAEYWEGKMGYFDRVTKQFMEEKFGYIDRTGHFVWRSP